MKTNGFINADRDLQRILYEGMLEPEHRKDSHGCRMEAHLAHALSCSLLPQPRLLCLQPTWETVSAQHKPLQIMNWPVLFCSRLPANEKTPKSKSLSDFKCQHPPLDQTGFTMGRLAEMRFQLAWDKHGMISGSCKWDSAHGANDFAPLCFLCPCYLGSKAASLCPSGTYCDERLVLVRDP